MSVHAKKGRDRPTTVQTATKNVSGLKRWLMRCGDLRIMTLLLFVVGLALRLYRLDAQSLWIDELNTWWMVVHTSWGSLIEELFKSESAYPLYHLLLKAWIALAGDSEWAMRFPSALAGALAVVALFFASRELVRGLSETSTVCLNLLGLIGPLLLLFAPFGLWFAQEVKTYSLLLCSSAFTLWLTLLVLRRNDLLSWSCWLIVAGLSVFVHRFALLLLVGTACAWLWQQLSQHRDELRSHMRKLLAVGLGIAAFSIFLVWQITAGLGEEDATTGDHIAAGPLQASVITLWRFALDRGPWEAPWFFLLPSILLTLWGLWLLLRDALSGNWRAQTLLSCLLVPFLLFSIQLWWTRLFEPRYLIIVYPAWLLFMAYPLTKLLAQVRPDTRQALQPVALAGFVSLCVLASNLFSLYQPVKGLWSGDPVKEQYREAIAYAVKRAQPSDIVILHPEYLRTAWNYYAPRTITSQLPNAIAFDAFKKRQTEFSRRDWDASRDRALSGFYRSYLLIAPAHARTVDPPNPAYPDDEYGYVGLYYQFSWEQSKWPCGGARYNGVHILCQSSPESYVTGKVAEPETPLRAEFGDGIFLKGYSLPDGPFLAGGVLPVTLYWEVETQPSEDFSVFLHVCQDCDQPPAAGDDGPPLGGGVPTSIWKPGHPVHDERTVVLPRDLAPGSYQLLVGLYRPGDPSPDARLTVMGDAIIDTNRVVLATVQIIIP
jgi:Predicted membrane protein